MFLSSNTSSICLKAEKEVIFMVLKAYLDKKINKWGTSAKFKQVYLLTLATIAMLICMESKQECL